MKEKFDPSSSSRTSAKLPSPTFRNIFCVSLLDLVDDFIAIVCRRERDEAAEEAFLSVNRLSQQLDHDPALEVYHIIFAHELHFYQLRADFLR
jgi:hypothetical protein